VSAFLARLTTTLPQGRALSDEHWWSRHRGVLVLLWLHLPVLGLLAVRSGIGVLHAAGELSLIVLPTLIASIPSVGRRTRAAFATLGLVTCSAMLIHVTGGLIESHFHLFVVIAVIGLYADWVPFAVAIGYVLVHHGTAGVLAPELVYDHPAALAHPLRWTLIHTGAVGAAAAVGVVKWRLHDALQTTAGELERLRMESERAAVAERQETQRLRDELLSVVSHELRGPLTTIMGFSEVLLDDDADLTEAQRLAFVTRIATQARRLERLMTGIFDASEANGTAEPAHTHLSRSIRLLVDDVVAGADRDRVTVAGVPPGLCVELPYRSLRLIVGNLLDNALVLAKPATTLAVEVGTTGEPARVVLTCTFEHAGTADPAQLIEPLTEPRAGGDDEGIGLHLVARIARTHGGTIAVEGAGSTTRFTVELPGAMHEQAGTAVAVPA
jgi:signal transduction histidine kinase